MFDPNLRFRVGSAAAACGLSFVLLIAITGCSHNDAPSESWSITHQLDFGRQPVWSPLGGKLVFGGDCEDRFGLWLWTPGSSPVSLVDSFPSHNWDYGWSPDGSRIVFSAPGDSDQAGIWVLVTDTRALTRLFNKGRDPSWRSGGDSIAVQLDHPETGAAGIYFLDVATGEAVIAVEGGFKPRCSPTSPAWAYADGEIDGSLHLVDSQGADVIVTGPGAVQWAWSRGGSCLCASVDNYNVGTIKGILTRIWLDGARVTIDSALAAWTAYPAPNSDGSRIAFQRQSGGRWAGLWLYNDDGGEIRIADYGDNPCYNPTGDRIAMNAPGGGIRILTRD